MVGEIRLNAKANKIFNRGFNSNLAVIEQLLQLNRINSGSKNQFGYLSYIKFNRIINLK